MINPPVSACTRRHFLATAGLAAVASVLAQRRSGAEEGGIVPLMRE